jgi:starch synthase
MSQTHPVVPPFSPTRASYASGYGSTEWAHSFAWQAGAIQESEELVLAPASALDVEAALRGRPLRVLMVAAEAVPYLKTGGPADVTGPLAHALRRMGHDVRLALPRYKSIDLARWGLRPALVGLRTPINQGTEVVDVYATEHQDGLRIAFIDAPHAFQREQLYGYADDGERFILFCRAVLEYVRAIDWAPDVIHCHDWHTAIIPNWTKTLFQGDPFFGATATVYTIHNLAHHGMFGYRILEVAGVAQEGFLYPGLPELSNVVDLMGRGILFADVVSTVSPRYAREILTPTFGEGLDQLLRERKGRLYGILNGIDTEELDPATDRTIAARFDAFALGTRVQNKRALQRRLKLPVEDDTPLLGMVSRLNAQKGFDLLEESAESLLRLGRGIQLVTLGTGDQHYHQLLQRLAAAHPRQVAVQFTFSDELSRAIYAGADMLLMPSRFEPCGLNQMIAMRYGCIPIVHRIGGLADTVQDLDEATRSGTGFSFSCYKADQLIETIARAIAVYQNTAAWQDLMQRAMLTDHSWDASAEHYIALYRRAQELQRMCAANATERHAEA